MTDCNCTSPASGFEKRVSEATFKAWSIPAILNSTPVRVIVDRSIDVADAEGNVRFVAVLVHAIKGSLPAWDPDDLLEVDGGNARLQQVIIDDGYIQKIEASPVG